MMNKKVKVRIVGDLRIPSVIVGAMDWTLGDEIFVAPEIADQLEGNGLELIPGQEIISSLAPHVPEGEGGQLFKSPPPSGELFRKLRVQVISKDEAIFPSTGRNFWGYGEECYLIDSCAIAYEQQGKVLIVPSAERMSSTPDAEGVNGEQENPAKNPNTLFFSISSPSEVADSPPLQESLPLSAPNPEPAAEVVVEPVVEAVAPVPTVEPIAESIPPVIPPAVQLELPIESQEAQRILGGTATVVITEISKMKNSPESIPLLERMLEFETQGNGRKTVLASLSAKIESCTPKY